MNKFLEGFLPEIDAFRRETLLHKLGLNLVIFFFSRERDIVRKSRGRRPRCHGLSAIVSRLEQTWTETVAWYVFTS